MGTTADKLNGVLNSKNAIKTALQNKGIDIGNSKFSEYATKINEITIKENFYKCNVITPAVAEGIIVTGTSGASPANGTYILEDTTKSGTARVWKNGSDKIFWDNGSGWIALSSSSKVYFRQNGSGAFESPLDVTSWTNGFTSGTPVLTYKEAVPSTWSGYMAQFNDDGQLDWSTQVTSGLTISGSIVPVINGVYNKTATKEIKTVSEISYTPSTENQIISGNTLILGNQIILGDPNLIASNIKAGVTIFGISGTYVGLQSNIDQSNNVDYPELDLEE